MRARQHIKKYILGMIVLCIGMFAEAEDLIDLSCQIPEKIMLEKTKCGQCAGIMKLEGRKSLYFEFDCSKAGYLAFRVNGNKLQMPDFQKAEISVEVYIPEGGKISTVSLRLIDVHNERIQLTQKIPSQISGWISMKFPLNANEIFKTSWAGNPANQKLDFPVMLQGFAINFSEREGEGMVGFEKVRINILNM